MTKGLWIKIVLVAVAMVLAVITPALAKSFRITAVDIDARLRPDGSMAVNEERTYSFSGSFSFAYRYMPGGQGVDFDEFEVYEEGRPYQLSNSEAPGTYRVTRSGGKTRITWYYQASNESRTFGFRYVARDAVERYDDAAVLYYKFLSDEWEKDQSNVSVTLVPPEPIERTEINEWLHGPLWAESRITDEGTVLAHCSLLPARTFLEIRALYPPEIFPKARASAGNVRAEIMAEEAAWVEKSNRMREEALEKAATREKREEAGKWVMIGLALMGLFGWYGLYKRYGRRPELPQFLDMTSEVPGKTPPALVGYLLHQRQVSGAGLVGTMLDLARQGFVELREEKVQKKRFWGGMKEESEYHWDLSREYWNKHAADLQVYERSLLAFIFEELAGGEDSISLDRIKKKRRDFIKFFKKWRKTVSEVAKKEEWYDEASIRGAYYSVGLGVAMMLMALAGGFYLGIWAIVLGAAGVAVTALSFLIYHRTAKGETEARHWMALKKYLKTYEFRSQSRQDLLSRISNYLVYGAVLGMSTKFYRELAAVIPEGEHASYVPWYVYHGAGARGFSAEAFGQAFSSMVMTTSSAMSTASGAGGGASAGGGGGASSGGGGAG